MCATTKCILFNKYTKIQRVCLRGIKLFSHNVPSSMIVFYSQSCSMLPSFLCELIKVGCEKKRGCVVQLFFQPQINLISGKGGIFNNTSRLEIHANANFVFQENDIGLFIFIFHVNFKGLHLQDY